MSIFKLDTHQKFPHRFPDINIIERLIHQLNALFAAKYRFFEICEKLMEIYLIIEVGPGFASIHNNYWSYNGFIYCDFCSARDVFR